MGKSMCAIRGVVESIHLQRTGEAGSNFYHSGAYILIE